VRSRHRTLSRRQDVVLIPVFLVASARWLPPTPPPGCARS
jgi:hypothetical protein